MPTLTTSATPMTGGQDAIAGAGKTYRLVVGGTWVTGDDFLINIVETASTTVIPFGFGSLTASAPVYLKTFRKKMYLLNGTTMYFSAISNPTSFNDLSQPGAGFIEMSDEQALVEDLVALASYQGKLAVFGRNHIQIFAVDPDPANYTQTQLLENIGTVAGRSVKSIGDLDVLFCADSGIRSLRVRDASNNATLIDLGTPIDTLIQAALGSADTDQLCATVEPRSNRYWFAIGSTIYVFSYFPSSDVIAWSTYTCSYDVSGTQTTVSPIKFEIHLGRIYAICTNGQLLAYGGATGNQYDAAICSWTTPWLSADQPATKKGQRSFDTAMEGSWTFSISTDPTTAIYKPVYVNTDSSFSLENIPYATRGEFVSAKAETSGSGYARFGEFICHFQPGTSG